MLVGAVMVQVCVLQTFCVLVIVKSATGKGADVRTCIVDYVRLQVPFGF